MKYRGLLKLKEGTMFYYLYDRPKTTTYYLDKELFDLLELKKLARVQIKIKDEIILDEIGIIDLKNNSIGLESWFVGDVCLSDILWELTDKEIELNIDFDSPDVEKIQKKCAVLSV